MERKSFLKVFYLRSSSLSAVKKISEIGPAKHAKKREVNREQNVVPLFKLTH